MYSGSIYESRENSSDKVRRRTPPGYNVKTCNWIIIIKTVLCYQNMCELFFREGCDFLFYYITFQKRRPFRINASAQHIPSCLFVFVCCFLFVFLFCFEGLIFHFIFYGGQFCFVLKVLFAGTTHAQNKEQIFFQMFYELLFSVILHCALVS